MSFGFTVPLEPEIGFFTVEHVKWGRHLNGTLRQKIKRKGEITPCKHNTDYWKQFQTKFITAHKHENHFCTIFNETLTGDFHDQEF